MKVVAIKVWQVTVQACLFFLKKNTKDIEKMDWCPLLTTVAPSVGGVVASFLLLCSISLLLAAVEWQWWAAPTGLRTNPSEWKKIKM